MNSQEHGGEVTDSYCEADFVLGDPTKTQIPTQGTDKIISYKFVLDSIAAKRLRPPSTYELVITGLRSGRRHFTLQDDIDLENYLVSLPEGVCLSGNEIYKRLEKLNPGHSWQSWRNRYLYKIKDKIKIARDAQLINKVPTANNSSTSQIVDPDDLATEEILESAINKTIENEVIDTNDSITLDDDQSLVETSGNGSQKISEDVEIQDTSQQTSETLGKRRRIDEDVQEQSAVKRQRFSAIDIEFLLKVKELSEEFHVPKTEVIRLLGDSSCNFDAVRDRLSNNVISEKYFWENEEDALLVASSSDDTHLGDLVSKHGKVLTRERQKFLDDFLNSR